MADAGIHLLAVAVCARSAASNDAGGLGRRCQVAPPSVVAATAGHSWPAQGTAARAHPVELLTQVRSTRYGPAVAGKGVGGT